MVTLIKSDLDFILDQIKLSEEHATKETGPGTPLTSVRGGILGIDPTLPYGVRTVDGTWNNVLPGQTDFGAADILFPRLVPGNPQPAATGDPDGQGPVGVVPTTYAQSTGTVIDPQPRIASNLVVDQSSANPAAVEAYNAAHPDEPPQTVQPRLLANGDPNPLFVPVLVIENVAPDEGLSAPFNSWFTLFGQFFDHGLDLLTKGGNGTVIVPLQPDDPLYVAGSPTNFMVLTRATQFNGPGADGVPGTPDDTNHEAQNTTTSFVDQNQTYTSHSSHQVFLRAYELDANGRPVATGELLNGANGGLPTWAEVKAQAQDMLGINLVDSDIVNVPLLLTDEYGRFLRGPNGFPMLVTSAGPPVTAVEGNPAAPISTAGVARTNHAFLDDIANNAAPTSVFDPDGPTIRNTQGVIIAGGQPEQVVQADTDNIIGNTITTDFRGRKVAYDDELLDQHFITGDGRGNENIGLTSVHHIFHAEHNRLVEHIQDVILATGDAAFIAEWQLPDGSWNGERVFQAARFGTEMQYQHLVFEEFARKVQPSVNVFAGYDQSVDASIVAEFAHVVYRFGHSMLTETVDRLDANGQPLQQLDANGNPVFDDLGNPVLDELGLIEAFLNPVAYNVTGEQAAAQTGNGVDSIADQAAGAVIRAMTRQVGNEIDEFVTDVLRNNLLGLPLDLATINMTRAREQGVPTLNEARREFYAGTAASSDTGNGDSQLKPYESWSEFAGFLKNPISVINFIAAYGTHTSITGATALEAKRAAATALVLGGDGAPVDRLDFLNSTGAWASTPGTVAGARWDDATITGLDDVDFWLGGLAEKKMPFGGMLGSTFNFVFETQLEKLQDGDRFYYLTRTAGLNFLTELEGNSFASLIDRNTDLDTDGMHVPGDIFSVPGHILEVDITRQIGADPAHELTGNPVLDAVNALNPLVSRNNPATPGSDNNYLQYTGGDHVVLGGTDATNDILIASIGDDTLWGDGGNDRLEGGAGNDILNGGDGDDIIQDTFGDDNLKGGEGNDAIHGGQGLFDLILGGGGSDFTVGGADVNETFGGRGNDFIYAGPAIDTVFGGEGDDWIEGGDQADLLQGDNGAPFQDSDIIGNDVIIGQGGNDDYDSESGDDIMVAGPGVSRFEGMLGFDWVTYERDPLAANADLFFTGLLPPDLEANRDRFDLAEGISGGALNDVIRGDNSTAVDLSAIEEVSGQNNALNTAAQIALIEGLQGVLGAGTATFAGGNILLGGGGSDVLEGRGGDDIIDGDSMLNVRLAGLDVNGVAFTADQMADIQARVFAGEINPGAINIIREIVDGDPDTTTDLDTAVFSGDRAQYQIDDLGAGVVRVTHLDLVVGGGAIGVDGVDRLINIERLQFADQVVELVPGLNALPVGNPIIDGFFQVGQTLSVRVNLDGSLANVTDADNPNAGLILPPFTVTWQVEDGEGSGVFVDTGFTGLTFTPTNGTELEFDNLAIRAVVNYIDGAGIPNSTSSAASPPLIPPTNLLATEGDDILVGTQVSDTINALGGDDIIFGIGGNDNLTGGAGNDIIDGGDGALDRAIFTGPRDDFVFEINAEGELEVVNLVTGEEDIVRNIERFRFIDGATVVNVTLAQALATIPDVGTENADILNGTAGDDDIAGLGGNDTINGLGGADTIDGGAGDDTINGNGGDDGITGGLGNDTIDAGGGDDTIFWAVGDGTDTIDGGAGTDRLRIAGSDDDEEFFVSTVAEFTARTGAALSSIPAGTDIVISRSVAGGPEAVISYNNRLDEIDINSGGGNDVFTVSGDFAGTDLDPNTITITGTSDNDTIDISGLDSQHRIVFQSNGGDDVILGTLRPIDVIELAPGTGPGDYTSTPNGNGTTTLSHGNHSITFASAGTPTLQAGPGAPTSGASLFQLSAADLAGLKAIVTGNATDDDEVTLGIRTLSGEGNNTANPDYGAADTPFIRLTDAHYGDFNPATGNRDLNPIFDGLDARTISNILGDQEDNLPKNANGGNIFFMAFGQYFDHGLDFLPKGGNGTVAIGSGADNPADLTRGTVYSIGDDGVPQHLNKTSAYVDQNQSYGSNALVGQFLREGDGQGGLGAKLLQGVSDPSAPDYKLLPTLRELIHHHWDNNTVFRDGSGGQVTFRSYFAGFVEAGVIVASAAQIKAMADNFMGSGHALLLDTNPFINLLDHFVAGDGRANENVSLTSIHTIWARNHNFHAENLQAAGFDGTAEQLFEAAKVLNEAEYQRVVFDEFADALIGGMKGSGSHGHDDYNPGADASISHEFAAAVYRVGHSLISDQLTVIGSDGQPRQVALVDAFLNPTNEQGAFTAPLPPGYVPQPGFEQLGANAIIAGTITQPAEEVDFNIVDAVRNDLVRIRADLFAFNVARGRDVGLGTLNQVRADLQNSDDPYIQEAVGFAGNLNPYTSWEDFQARNGLSTAVINQFRQAYPDLVLSSAAQIAAFVAANPDIALADGPGGTKIVKGIDRVDLWVGGLAEAHINGGMVGQTFWIVLHEQFDRLQEADRFYYTDRLDGFDLYENIIDGQNFADIIARNTGLTNLPEHVFEADDEDDGAGAGGGDDDDDDDDAGTGGGDDDDDDDDAGTGGGDDDDDDDAGTGGGDDDNAGCDTDDNHQPSPNTGGTGGSISPFVVYFGTSRNDTGVGSAGHDTLAGEDGDDTLIGMDGDDNLAGGQGADELSGGAGKDILFGNDGADKIFAGAGNDTVVAGRGRDVIFGDDGDDLIFGDEDRDQIDAGAGNDTIFASVGDGDDAINGSAGNDTLNLEAITSDTIVDLGATGVGYALSAQSGEDTLGSIENVMGGAGDDTIYASNAANVINGGAGADTIVFSSAGSTVGDRVEGFQPGDKIDLRPIYNSLDLDGDRFDVIASGSTFTEAGQIRLRIDGLDTLIEGNTDNPADTDFSIRIAGRTNLTGNDFA